MATPSIRLLRRHRLTPLVAALAALLPLTCLGAGPVVPPPPPATVPVPGATWRTYGTGNTAGPVNIRNAAGGIDQTINQTSQKAIYDWQSFDIGATSSVTFDMALKGASALNRVTGSGTASQIYGRLSATNGGEIYLINANGILFGRTAVVNTGGLIASGLDVTDANFKASLVPAMTAADNFDAVAFQYKGDPANFTDEKNFVRVEPGATITTGSGGRVFLFAKNVQNSGTITTPDGQTALAGGSEVFLRLPSGYLPVYAAESNPNLPVLRGLLVDVGDAFQYDPTVPPEARIGRVTNAAAGTISTPRGNTTLVGLAVNQMGRISATTSVSENGTIFLRAQGNAQITAVGGDTPVVPQTGGTLTIGPGSRTEILPDGATVGGIVPTSTDIAGFVGSRVDMVGKTVELQSGASVVAPGATVNLRAESTPTPDVSTPPTTDPEARIVLDAGASIDVSGTRDAMASVDRFFVRTDVLTSSDLADAPLQKAGILYHAKATIDVREDSLILGDLARYRGALERNVDERLSAGGTVDMVAQGAVMLAPGSRIDVSGGQVTYTHASVQPTQVVSSTGALYSLNDAPADQVYLYGLNMQKGSLTQYDRWGAIPTPGLTTTPRDEPGYVEGRAAGTVRIDAPAVVMQGSMAAGTVTGERQRMGLDPVAAPGRLEIGDAAGFDLYDGAKLNGQPTLLQDFRIDAQGPAITPGTWQNPLEATLLASGVALSTITRAGFGDVTVSAQGDVSLAAGKDLVLVDHASLTLQSATGDASLSGDVKSHDGTVMLSALNGHATVADGAQIDLAGRWINQQADASLEDTTAIAGGRFAARGAQGVTMGRGSLVDVSGGATVTTDGTLKGGAAGGITLLAGRTDIASSDADPASDRRLDLAGVLRGDALQDAQGGALALRAPSVRIGADAPGQPDAAFHLDADFFTRGGFSSYAVDGLAFLDLSAGTSIAPTRQAWYAAGPDYRYAATGSDVRDVLALGRRPLSLPPTVSLALASSGLDDGSGQAKTGGQLDLDAGSRIEIVPGSSFTGTGAVKVRVEGGIVDHGGDVTLSTRAAGAATDASYVWVGRGATIDVSGTTLVTPSTDGLVHGQVQDGGQVVLSAAASAGTLMGTSIVVQEGARIDLDGTVGTVDMSERGVGGTVVVPERVASHGGSLSITGTSDLRLEGAVSARGGDAQAAGGSISVKILGAADSFANDPFAPPPPLPTLRLVDAPTHLTHGLTPDELPTPQDIATGLDAGSSNAQVSAQWVAASGAADLSLSAVQRLDIQGGVNLRMPRHLALDAQALAVDDGGRAFVSGATTIVGNTQRHDNPNGPGAANPPPEAHAGDGELTIHGTDLVVDGDLVTQHVSQLTLSADHDLQLRSSFQGGSSGTLATAADVTLDAGQVYPATGQHYTISAPRHAVTITGGDPQALEPLSAGGTLDIEAGTIAQDGVVRAPFGTISLDAHDRLVVGAGSETSVSGAGLVVSWGTTTNGATTWNAPLSSDPTVVTALPGKSITLTSPQVTTAAGAKVDLAGGGTVVAYEFVAGPGGTKDVFAGGNGAYAIVPGVQGLAPYDPDAFATAAAPGAQIVIGPGGPVPAGTYTLLPARDALLPGAFLVTPDAGAPVTPGAVLRNPDGSAIIGARLADADTGFTSALPSAWRVLTGAQARKFSQVLTTSADDYFAALAKTHELATPRGAADGGVFQLTARSADIAGTFDFRPAQDDAGRATGLGGIAAFAASHIVVGEDTTPPPPDALVLSARQLDAMAPATLLLGGTVGDADTQGTRIDVVASRVEFENTRTALAADDIVAVSTGSVIAHDGVTLAARAPTATSAAPAAFQIEGEGAALRLADASGASLVRTGSDGARGALSVGQGAVLDAGAGTLVLDGPVANVVGSTATLRAADITLAAGVVQVGDAPAKGALVLNDTLLDQVNGARHLTLRGYDRIAFLADTRLGGDALTSVTLDSGKLLSAAGPASVEAGEIALANTTGAVQNHGGSGTGSLTLHADATQGTGRILLGDGTVAINGTQALVLDADRALVLDGAGKLQAGGDIEVRAPRVIAQVPTSGAESAADYAITTPGDLRLAPGDGAPDAARPAVGARLGLSAASIAQGGDIELPSGRLALDATEGDVSFLAGSRTDLAGVVRMIDGTAVGTGGGGLSANAAQHDVNVAAGATVDVSAGGDAAGGSARFSAPEGAVSLAGTLTGTATHATRGARLEIDGQQVPTLTQVAALQQQAATNFDGALDVRQRGAGTMTLAAGTTLKAHEVSLDDDAGAIVVAGTIAAAGAQGGRIDLAARDDLTLAAGALLDVHATGSKDAGGSIALTTAAGELALRAGATLDLGADAAADHPEVPGGRLTLRAPRTGYSDADPQGTDVAIAAIGAQVKGASSVDVQAVKVYDGITAIESDPTYTPGVLSTVQLAMDDTQFLGYDGHVADAVATRLAGADPGLLAQMRVHPEDEVRAPGDLTVAQAVSGYTGSDDWALPNASTQMAFSSAHVGDSSLTLRVAGDLSVQRTISAGFDPVYSSPGADERYATTNSDHAGNIRLVAGADMGAADAMRVRDDGAALAIGRDDQPKAPKGYPRDAFNIVAVRSTTGDLELAASGNIDMQHNRSLVYTVGRQFSDPEVDAVRQSFYPYPGTYVFNVGAGGVTLRAGGSILGNDEWREPTQQTLQAEEFSAFRTMIEEWQVYMPDGSMPLADAWRLQTIGQWDVGVQHGAFSFGGGNVTARAGKDIVNFEALSPTSGYVLRDVDTLDATATRTFGGGNVTVSAGRDVVNGLFESGGAQLTVAAGRDLAWRTSKLPDLREPGARLLTEDGRIDATAGRDLVVAYAQDAMTTQIGNPSASVGQLMTGLDGDADAHLQAAGGNAQLLLTRENQSSDGTSVGQVIVPARMSVTAPWGGIEVGGAVGLGQPSTWLYQFPTQASRFDLLAGTSIDFATDPVYGGTLVRLAPSVDLSHGPQLAFEEFYVQTTPLDTSDRTPVHIATVEGDVTLGQIDSARPMRVSAGQDLTLQGPITITHQPTGTDGDALAGETSSFQAGRDIGFHRTAPYGTGPLTIGGPGELLVMAGRNVDLGAGMEGPFDLNAAGIETVGNTVNGLLPKASANVTVIAGLRADGSDYVQAARMGFAVLGATGLTDHAADLYALLAANSGGQAKGLVALGSAQARAFAALDTDAQLAQVRALVGSAFYDAQIARYVRAQPGQSALSDAQAIAAFAGMSATKRAAAPGTILAQSFAGRAGALREGFIAELAGAGKSPYATALVDYMQRLQGGSPTLAQALAAFEALPLAQQVPLLDRVLVAEVRASGRAAAAATGAAQEAAYDRGYRTIATLFPLDRPEGDIEMPEAEVKTLQSGSITLLAPGGGVDAGGVQASTISPDHLGVVTVAGGDISSIVRDDFLVNQSRVFTLAPGNLLIWSSQGDIDAGRGAKSAVGAPAPVLRIDGTTGLLFLDTSGSFTGSGIAVLDADSTLDLYAPAGAIDAGEAGIKSAGNAFLAAQTFIGTDNLSVGGKSVGAPPPVQAGATAALASAGNALQANASAVADDQKEERRKRRMRRNLLIEFLGFGPSNS